MNPADTTVFVTTIGDQVNFDDCLEHLRAQTISRPIEIIDRVAPMSAALGEMHLRCRTPFYVQVDEDMMLDPSALERLEQRIVNSPPSTALVCAPLWDCDTERPLYGVKIYRHAIVSQFPYEDVAGCESHQLMQIEAAGYLAERLPLGLRDSCFGEHGKHYTPATAFRRWQRLMQKQILQGKRDWVEEWPVRLLHRYIDTRNPVHLYALLGAVAGAADPYSCLGELDFRQPNRALERLQKIFPLEP